MTDNTQPLALMLADRLHHEQPTVLRIDAERAGEELRRQHARIAELEAQLEAIGAGGVGPLTGRADSKEREAFEAWAIGLLGDNPNWRGSGACELAWQAFQAGRASLAASAGSEPVARADSWTNDQWIDLAQRHANADWDSDTPDGYLNAVTALCNDFATAHPSPPEGMVGGWMPIATAPEGQMVVVGWLALQTPNIPSATISTSWKTAVGGSGMNMPAELLSLMRLLSAMESAMLASKIVFPDYLSDEVTRHTEILEREILARSKP